MTREQGSTRTSAAAAAVALTALVVGAACSSGLEGLDPKGTTGLPELRPCTNLRFMFDPNVDLTAPMTDFDVTGGVIETLTGSRERPVAFVAFTTQTQIPDPDGLVTYQGVANNVFLAAVDANSIDERAFAYSLAGTMRHPRCVTCHQMNVDPAVAGSLPPTAFATQPHFPDGGGKPPLGIFTAESCETCHFHDWFAPGPSFDLRRESTRDLFLRAQVPPAGLDIHFKTDSRVLWALGNGQSPFGGAADDDHDGIDEPEDTDGTRRHAPGGVESFVKRFDAWLETRDPHTGELDFSSADEAVHDLVIVSRSANGAFSGNGPSRAPTLTYVPDALFDASAPTSRRAGTVILAYESDATNMNGGTDLGFSDVFRVEVDVWLAADGRIDLRYIDGSQVLVSRAFDASTASGSSTEPDISADGRRIAFTSAAFDLVPGMTAVCRPEVYVYDALASPNSIALVSRVPGNPLQPGDRGASRPRISSDGLAVCFESDATNLVAGDTNGARDVFYGLAPNWSLVRASLTDDGEEFEGHATHASIHHDAGHVRVAFAVQDDTLPSVRSVQCPDDVLVLQATSHAHVRNGTAATLALGAVPLRVGRQGTAAGAGNQFRSLVRFDLSQVPFGATIRSVELRMFVIGQSGSDPNFCPSGPIEASIGVHRVTSPWSVSTVTWNSILGSFAPVASQSNDVQGTGLKAWTDDVLGGGLVADVQGWVDSNGATNFGWLFDADTAFCNIKTFADTNLSIVYPSLVVNYSPPSLGALPSTPGAGSSCVYLRDTASGRTHDLTSILGPQGSEAAERFDIDGTPLPLDAVSPVIGPRGDAVLFATSARNLDVVRDFDENRVSDIVLVDLRQLDQQGFVLPLKLSVTADGGMGDEASHTPVFADFAPPTDAFPLGLALLATRARNLGNDDPGDIDGDGVPEFDNHLVLFLNEAATTVADFVAAPARQGIGRDVEFVNTSSGTPDTFTWDFGDGSAISNLASPTHVYTTPGRYTVTLTAAGELGDDSRTRTDYVHVLGPVEAAFTTSKDIANAPLQALAPDVPHTTAIVGAVDGFDAASFLGFDADGSASTEFPEQFVWTLRRVNAGGQPISAPQVVSNDAQPVGVTIATTGFFELALEATGPGGAGTASQRIDVFQMVEADFATDPTGLIVRGPANLHVQFTDASTGDLRASDPLLWNFGDGNVSTDNSPLHVYSPGVYFASLTVFGRGLDSSTSATVPVIADGPITAAFAVVPRPVGSLAGVLDASTIDDGAGLFVDFLNLSLVQSGAPLFHRWSFSNGIATGQQFATDPVGVPYALGVSVESVQTFNVTLVTSTTSPAPVSCAGQPAGTCASIVGTLTIHPRPVPSFPAPAPSFTPPGTPLRPPHTVAFTGNVVGDGAGTEPLYRWLRSAPNQPDANIQFASSLSVQHEFDEPGLYKVALEVETNGPGGTRQIVRSAERDVIVTASTLTDWIDQALLPSTGAKCVTCHSGVAPPAGLLWSGSGSEGVGTTAEIFARIVMDQQGHPIFSTRCDTNERLIQPFDPDRSVVHNVLLDGAGPLCSINMRVNLGGDSAAKDAHLAVLRSWIQSGAPNN